MSIDDGSGAPHDTDSSMTRTCATCGTRQPDAEAGTWVVVQGRVRVDGVTAGDETTEPMYFCSAACVDRFSRAHGSLAAYAWQVLRARSRERGA